MSLGPFELKPCGDDALVVLCGAGDVRFGLARALREQGSWVEVVPGKTNVTVSFDPHAERMGEALERLSAMLGDLKAANVPAAGKHVLLAEFGSSAGPDLAGVAARLSCSEAEIIRRVEQSCLSVDMLGFTPGFAYVVGLDPVLVSERLANPRARVAARSIGLITGQLGLYALEGPGGWPIIGRVHSPLFDRLAADPFVLKPGDMISIRQAPAP